LRPSAKSIRFPNDRTAAAINNHKPAAPWGQALTNGHSGLTPSTDDNLCEFWRLIFGRPG
jgi:hypothetical protein